MLYENVEVQQIEEGQTAGTGTTTSDAVDMVGFEGVMFIGSIATANAGNYAKVQQSSDDGSADAYGDLEGTKLVVSVSGNSFVIDVYRPLKRYLRCLQVIGSSSATGPLVAIKYGPKAAPTSHGSVIGGESHVSPAEGTA